jgi:hypothetical protein
MPQSSQPPSRRQWTGLIEAGRAFQFDPSRSGWTLFWKEPPESSKTLVRKSQELDEVGLQRLRKKAERGGTWEGAVLQVPVPVEQERGEANYPLLAMWADRHSGMILGFELGQSSTDQQLLVQ